MPAGWQNAAVGGHSVFGAFPGSYYGNFLPVRLAEMQRQKTGLNH